MFFEFLNRKLKRNALDYSCLSICLLYTSGVFISSSLLNLCRANGINIKSFDDADSINSIHKLCSILASKIKDRRLFGRQALYPQ